MQLLFCISDPCCLIIDLLEESILYGSSLIIDLMDIDRMCIVERGDGGNCLFGGFPLLDPLDEFGGPGVLPPVPVISSGGEVWIILQLG